MPSPATPPDHRPRVAAEKRERMRARLVETALEVFAERGVGASVIQEVIARAGVSQGTFYNYFRTNEDLLQAVSQELNNELVQWIEGAVLRHADPAQRLADGVRLYMHKARAFPLFGRFLVQAGLGLASPANQIYVNVPPHIEAGFAQGRFERMPMAVALDFVSGSAMAAIARMASEPVADDYPEQIVATLLHALGMSAAEARAIAFAPLAALNLPPESLAVRASQRMAAREETAA